MCLRVSKVPPEKKTQPAFRHLCSRRSWGRFSPRFNRFGLMASRPSRRNTGQTIMTDVNMNSLRNQPDDRGRFGMHGGRFVAETLMPLILKVEEAYTSATSDADFQRELEYY